MMWIAAGIAALIGIGLMLELLARIALLKMVGEGDGWDGND
jgi:hypothetical protein|nr:MAG TPA: hypothetical protein [Caudoviricetes sp.]